MLQQPSELIPGQSFGWEQVQRCHLRIAKGCLQYGNIVAQRFPAGRRCDYDDVPALVAKAIHDGSGSGTEWENLSQDKRRKKASDAKKWLNTDAVGNMTRELLLERDPDNELTGYLREIGELLGQSE